MNDNGKYDDIINMPHHISKKHPQMSIEMRSAQFAPFAALTGYEDAVEELNRKSSSFKGNLLRAKIVCEVLNEDDLYNLIYRELNKNSAMKISPLKEGGKNLYVGKVQKTKQRN